MIVDSHCHLDFPDFAAELDAVVARARAAGIGAMVTISTRIAAFSSVLNIARQYDDVFCSVGTHPHNAGEEIGISTRDIVELADNPEVVAIGEAGLDYHYDHAPRQAQLSGFRNHIAAARETGLPLVIHARDADDDIGAVLSEEMKKGAFPFVLHCFSSGRGLAETGIELGGYVSFSGIAAFKKSEELRDIARDLPIDRLLVETDAPYLAPPPHRGKRNEPAFVVHTARILAEALDIPEQRFAAQTSENFFRLFSRAKLAGTA
jgi:TatD DNase family protein